ncbi:MAG: tetratricopeptide repeat protein, partial [Verrucomicrobiota bacterium]
ENYDEAIKRYKQFIGLKPEAGSFNAGAYFINLGVCYAKTEDLKNATTNISKAFDNAARYKATPEALWQGFLSLAKLWVSGDEKAGEEGFGFLKKYRQQLNQPGYRVAPFTGQLLQLGQGAEGSGKPELALKLFALVPKTEAAILQAKADYGTLPSRVKDIVGKLESQLGTGDPAEVNAYFGIARAHDQMNNKRAGFVLYEELANHYPKSKSRPQILYAATATASAVREMLKAQTFGMTFLKEFPNHELADDVASLLLSSLFYNQEYEKCIDIAGKIRKPLTVGSKDRDLADFVYGGSLYYLGRYEEAQPELDSHVTHYEKSPYRENSSFYQASNLTKQYRWKEAAEKLDAWLKIYEPKKSALLDVAFLDRANCYFAMANSENGGNDKALRLISRIEKEYPASEILDRALNLRGDVYQHTRQLPAAEESYLAGLRIAEERDHPETAASGLAQLVPVCNAQKKYKEAIGHYDHFFRDFPETSYAPNVGVFGLPSFKEGNPNRLPEATQRLEKLIVVMAEQGDSAGLEKAVNSYASFHLEQMKEKPDEVIARLDKRFPNERGLRSLQAWLLIAKIGIIEKRLKDKPDSDARLR